MYQGHLSLVRRLRRTFQSSQAFSNTRPLLTVKSHPIVVRVGRPFMVEKVITSGVNVK